MKVTYVATIVALIFACIYMMLTSYNVPWESTAHAVIGIIAGCLALVSTFVVATFTKE